MSVTAIVTSGASLNTMPPPVNVDPLTWKVPVSTPWMNMALPELCVKVVSSTCSPLTGADPTSSVAPHSLRLR